MRILVTGAFGYLGLALVRRLAGEHEVIATGHPARTPAARAAVPAGAQVVEADVEDIVAVAAAHGPFDAVVHLAGGDRAATLAAGPVAAVRAHVRGAALVARGARSPRMLLASSLDVYGGGRAGVVRESDGTAPDDLYGAVKESAELVWDAAGGTALRLAPVFGAGSGVDFGREDTCDRFARAAAAGADLVVEDGGARGLDVVHIDDVVGAFEAALRAPRDLPPAINIGGGALTSVGTLASAALSAALRLGARPRIVARDGPPAPRAAERSLAIGLAGNVLGWKPRVSLHAGFEGLVALMKKSVG